MAETKRKPRGKPLAKGFDPRRHLTGQPKKGTSLAEKFRDAMERQVTGQPEGYTNLDYIIDIAIGAAKEGDWTPLEYVLARGWGKMPDRLEIGVKQKEDLSKLSTEEYEQYKALKMKTLLKDTNGNDDSGE